MQHRQPDHPLLQRLMSHNQGQNQRSRSQRHLSHRGQLLVERVAVEVDRVVLVGKGVVGTKEKERPTPPLLWSSDAITVIGHHTQLVQLRSCGHRPLFDSTISMMRRCWKWCLVYRCFFSFCKSHITTYLVVWAQRCILRPSKPVVLLPFRSLRFIH